MARWTLSSIDAHYGNHMSSTAIILIAISALLHASWNLISKKEHPTAAFFLAVNLIGTLFLCPLLFFYGYQLAQFPPLVWVFLGLTGLCQAVYMVSLAGAYRHGDISIAYPVVRSSPMLVVMVVVFILGRGDQVSSQSIAGIFLVVLGSVVLPMKHFADFRVANYRNPSCLLGLLAACATAGYSVIDDEALRRLQGLPELGIDAVETTLLYALMQGSSACLWLGFVVLVKREGRAAFARVVRAQMRPAALTGVGMYITYPLVLVSMAFVDNVSYVVAFRQISIPIGVGLGILLLNEPRYVPKFAGTALIFVGLLLVGTG